MLPDREVIGTKVENEGRTYRLARKMSGDPVSDPVANQLHIPGKVSRLNT